MKVFDIVFSPTGGTEKVSNYIVNALEGETVAVDLTDSGFGFRTVAMTKEDVAVIAVPSYGGRVPAVAVERLGMVRGNDARAVLVCVYGNRAYEDTLVELEDAAKGAGFRVIAAVSAIAEHSIVRSLPPADQMRRTRHSLLGLRIRFSKRYLQEMLLSRLFRVIVPIRRSGAPVWCLRPQRSAPLAGLAPQRVPLALSIKTTPSGWTKRPASLACAVSPYVRGARVG